MIKPKSLKQYKIKTRFKTVIKSYRKFIILKRIYSTNKLMQPFFSLPFAFYISYFPVTAGGLIVYIVAIPAALLRMYTYSSKLGWQTTLRLG